ncbi:hypothetical protein BZF66_06040 [Salmonella enterica]|nr:hypothetical protein [Salmonella enterica]ECV9083988.1 hypothetical protein [Salmonella enterica subsp. enterica serovar Infantis]EHX8550305.1 hypothetical protein [Salmonella enterica]EME3783023.1 hypothetical protein [Salmonella enterica]
MQDFKKLANDIVETVLYLRECHKNRVVNFETRDSMCYLIERQISPHRRGMVFAADDGMEIFFDFEPAGEIDLPSKPYEEQHSSRFFTEHGFLYYHPSLPYFNAVPSLEDETRNLVVPLPSRLLNEDEIFQYMTILSPDEIFALQLTNYMKHITAPAVGITFRNLNESRRMMNFKKVL